MFGKCREFFTTLFLLSLTYIKYQYPFTFANRVNWIKLLVVIQPDQWDEYQRNKQKDSSDSEDEGDDARKDSQEMKKEGKDEIKKKLKLSDLTIEIDDNIPLSKVKELLTR